MKRPIVYLVDNYSGEAVRQATPVEIATAKRSPDAPILYQGTYSVKDAHLGRIEVDANDNMVAVALTKAEIEELIP